MLHPIEGAKVTYYRWLKRYCQQGWRGLQARSCRPLRQRRRQWTKQHQQAVLHLRKRHPFWGKPRICKVLSRDHGFALSISTVARILKHLVASKRVRPVAFYYGRVKPKRQRQFKHHARRWRLGMRTRKPGELIQINSMSVNFSEGFTLKEFKASCPITATTIMRACSRASSRNARRFLEHLITQLPYPLISIQVDGGSEFRDEFEQAYQALDIPVFVLPPKKPKYNGCVARANGTSRYEFYLFYEGLLTLSAINQELDKYQHS